LHIRLVRVSRQHPGPGASEVVRQDSSFRLARRFPTRAVGNLAVTHSFSLGNDGEGGSFKASPIVASGKVFVGSTGGYFYALDATTLNKIWQYPLPGQHALLGACNLGENGSFGHYGIQSSATRARLGKTAFGQEFQSMLKLNAK
jgi:hypothetical protein